MSNDTNASLCKTFVSFAAANTAVIKGLEAELSNMRDQLGDTLESAANNLEAFTECQYKLEASRCDYRQLLNRFEAMESELAESKLALSIANADLWEAKQDQREDDILLGRPVMPEGLLE